MKRKKYSKNKNIFCNTSVSDAKMYMNYLEETGNLTVSCLKQNHDYETYHENRASLLKALSAKIKKLEKNKLKDLANG